MTNESSSHQYGIYSLLQNIYAMLQNMRSNQRAMIGMLQTLTNLEVKMTVNIDALTAEIANNSTVQGSVVALLQQLAAQVSAIPPSSDPVTQAALDALVATLSQNDQTLADAVIANTPPAPASTRR
jgi:hypothetical protein